MSGEKLLLDALIVISEESEDSYAIAIAMRAIKEYKANTPIAYIKGKEDSNCQQPNCS